MSGKAGFPLDDAWIHQTYARNLVRSGRWEYTPGIVSAGSTAPLWTLLLALGYLLRLPYLFWTYFLGGMSLLFLAFGAIRLWRFLLPDQSEKDWQVGLAIVFTWPLVWAAASGMETMLFAALGLWITVLYVECVPKTNGLEANPLSPSGKRPLISDLKRIALLGLLSGLLILTRPDGIVLLLLLFIGINQVRIALRDRAISLLVYGGTAALLLIPYLLFNLRASGHIWPNTFYAKQAEYAIYLDSPIIPRLIRLSLFSLGGPETGWRGISGVHLVLLPGLLVSIWRKFKFDWTARRLYQSLPLLWAGGHVLLYAWRLPLTYQHGRYLLAVVPVWILYGLSGWNWIFTRAGNGRVVLIGRLVASWSFVVLLLFFLLLGGQSYATDVAFIEGEMVDVAHWITVNTPLNALIASHDIGAIGYFAERSLVDMAGLITPEIVPWLRDESALTEYILSNQADFLVTAPGWPYESIIDASEARLLYSTDYLWTQEQGENNMSVYALPSP